MRVEYPTRATCAMCLFLCASLLGAQSQSQQASDRGKGPDAAMMAPVTELAKYMAHVDGAALPGVFAEDGLVIVEDFEPFIFRGKDAAAQWDAGYRQHAVPLRDLKVTFGSANAFERTGDRVYFVLPTTWRGTYKDRRFEEHGAWSFVLTNSTGQWRILAYGWGATDLKDSPAKAE